MKDVLFTWHGGEPMLRPVSYYEKVMALQQKYAGGRNIDNCLQTNGTLVTDEYAEFFHRNGWLIGVSIDGPREYHDAYRRQANGGLTFGEVMKGIDILNRHHVEWNAMAVVNRLNGDHPVEFYRFFKEIGCKYIQFTPVVDASRLGELTEYSVEPKQWGNFLCGLFDEWSGRMWANTLYRLSRQRSPIGVGLLLEFVPWLDIVDMQVYWNIMAIFIRATISFTQSISWATSKSKASWR